MDAEALRIRAYMDGCRAEGQGKTLSDNPQLYPDDSPNAPRGALGQAWADGWRNARWTRNAWKEIEGGAA